MRGPPPPYPLLVATHVKRALPFGGYSFLHRQQPACHVLGVHADRSCYLSLSLSTSGLLPPLWPNDRPLFLGSLWCLDCPPAPLAPVFHTCNAIACPFGAWRRRRRQNAFTGAPHCHHASPCPTLDAAAPPYPTLRHLLVDAAGSALNGCSGGRGVSVPSLPPPVLPRHYLSLGGHSGGFVPPGQLVYSRGVNALRQLDPPSHSLAVLPVVFRHSVGLMPTLLALHS